jgi:RNA polymerase sigma factor (sigma-70 family)
MEDLRLLREYSEKGSERAFATLVDRHIGLVYSTALRRLGDPQAAEDITQSVFCLLARKALRLGPNTTVAGWLHRAVCLATAKYWRTESRRRRHEQEATTMITDTPAQEATWEDLTPHLDDALNGLDDNDRLAVLQRFFQSKPFQEIGQALGITEDAARMRVNRALERLRLSLQRKNVVCSTAALATLLAGNAIEAVPAALAGAVGANALRTAGAASIASSLAALLGLMAREKLKTAAVIGAVALTGAIGLRLLRPSQTADLSSDASVASASANMAANNDTLDTLRPAAPRASSRRLSGSTTPAANTPPSLTARELYERAQAHQRENRYDEALADFAKSVELLDQGIGRWEWFTDVYFTRSGLLAHQKDYAGAIASLSRMLEFEPKRYSPRFNRAHYFTDLGQTEAAIVDYSAIVEDPETDFSRNIETKEKLLGRTYEYRGRVYEKRKEYDKAIADFTESLRVDPSGGDSMIVYWRRGLLYRASQQTDKALEDANSLSQWALQWATAADSKNSDRDRALSAARFGSEIFEHRVPFQLEVLAATRARAGDFSDAVSEQQRAIELLTPANEDQRPAMQARLDLYKAGKPLTKQ